MSEKCWRDKIKTIVLLQAPGCITPQLSSTLQLDMKFLVVLAGLSLVAAKPQFGKDLRLAEGRIIGGEEAPKRNYHPRKPFS